MGKDNVKLTFDVAVSLLDSRAKKIHTFVQPGAGMFIGADWDRKDILDAIRKGNPQIGGPACKGMGHGLVVDHGKNDYMFIETRKGAPEKLEADKLRTTAPCQNAIETCSHSTSA